MNMQHHEPHTEAGKTPGNRRRPCSCVLRHVLLHHTVPKMANEMDDPVDRRFRESGSDWRMFSDQVHRRADARLTWFHKSNGTVEYEGLNSCLPLFKHRRVCSYENKGMKQNKGGASRHERFLSMYLGGRHRRTTLRPLTIRRTVSTSRGGGGQKQHLHGYFTYG